jgi:hypothetical protein
MAKILREFSAAGPCLILGPVTKRTPAFIFYDDGGKVRHVGGWRVQSGHYHTEPCPSCRDHERTQYPEGYMD